MKRLTLSGTVYSGVLVNLVCQDKLESVQKVKKAIADMLTVFLKITREEGKEDQLSRGSLVHQEKAWTQHCTFPETCPRLTNVSASRTLGDSTTKAKQGEGTDEGGWFD